MDFDVHRIRKDFPALNQTVYGNALVYFDNAATSQKPDAVIKKITEYYSSTNSNVHRGVHYLSQKATDAFEGARETIRKYINAAYAHEVIITKGATDSINLVASSFSKKYLKKGDEVLISASEHHANIVPWQIACSEKEAVLRVVPLDASLAIDLQAYRSMLNEKTRMVAIGHISNAIGTVHPIREMIRLAHAQNIPVLIDGAQGIVHETIDVQDLDCDFYCFSSHKFYGPMGIGVLYGKEKWLEELPPYQTGGEMIKSVTFEETTFNDLPFKFETGTPNVADLIGFEAALFYIEEIGMDQIKAYENDLINYALEKLQSVEGVEILGPDIHRAGVISFNIRGIHPYDAGTIMDRFGIAIRTGNHCAQPVMDYLQIPGTIRASLAFYNTKEEVDRLVESLIKVKEMFQS